MLQSDKINIIRANIREQKTALSKLEKSIDISIIKAVNLLYKNKGRIIITGIGKNGFIQFVNGMAANDPVSTLQIWKFVIDRYPTTAGTAVFFNSRDDRPLRTKQMLELTFEEIKPEYFIIRGDKVESNIRRLTHHSSETKVSIFPFNETLDNVVESILNLPDDVLVYAIGNQVGAGQEILQKISKRRDHG